MSSHYRKFHSHILQFDGEGGWNLSLLDARTAMTLRQEKAHLEAQLADIPTAQQRLQVRCLICFVLSLAKWEIH